MADRAHVRGPDRPKAPGAPRETSASGDALTLNALLASLPAEVLERLRVHLQLVELESKDTLFRAHETLRTAYFPLTAIVSLLLQLESGQQLEVGIVGRDGLAGTSVFPGITTMSCVGVVQIAGSALRIDADMLRQQLVANETLYSSIGRYTQVLLARSMQLSACNMFHSVEQRCIRWLLTVGDLMDEDTIPLTHDLLATLLGVHRPTVTLVVRSLQKASLLDERRGLIILRDRQRLEAACCECYSVLRDQQTALLGY